MKRLFILLILFVAAIAAQAQSYIPFPTSNTIWTQRHGNGDTTPSYFCYGLTSEDTTINLLNYHRLFKSADTIFQPSECVGGLREDSMRRVYFYDYAAGHERMLYDFMVQPGDTVDYDPGSAGIVSSIDSVDLSGVFHKRINFQSYDGNFWIYGAWIEGMGNSSVGGLLGPAMLQPTCDCAENIICFRQDGEWLYHNPAYNTVDCLESTLAVKELSENKATITLYPNPLTGTGTIHISNPAAGGNVQVYDCRGVLLHQYPVQGNTDIAISSSEYAAGIYFYHFGTLAGKFVVE